MFKKKTLALALRYSSMSLLQPRSFEPSIIASNSCKLNQILNSGICRRNLSIRACYERKRVELQITNNFINNNKNNIVLNKSAAFSVDSGDQARPAAGSPNGHAGAIDTDRKIAVAVDVDEVLGNFISALNRFVADRYSSNHSISEYYVYEFFRIWHCTRDEADARVHEFFKTSYFKKGIHPIPGALRALQRVSSFCNLSVVTSRQNAIKDDTIQWIENHYPGLFQEIHFGNHFALEGQSRPKSDICRSLGAKVLIDDNPRYALECAEVGIRVLLFDYEKTYPWCKIESVDQHPLVTKVHSWEEVEHQLVTKIEALNKSYEMTSGL